MRLVARLLRGARRFDELSDRVKDFAQRNEHEAEVEGEKALDLLNVGLREDKDHDAGEDAQDADARYQGTHGVSTRHCAILLSPVATPPRCEHIPLAARHAMRPVATDLPLAAGSAIAEGDAAAAKSNLRVANW